VLKAASGYKARTMPAGRDLSQQSMPWGGPPICAEIWAAPASHLQLPCPQKQKL